MTGRAEVAEPASGSWLMEAPRRLEERAVTWLHATLDCFDPFTYPAGDRMGRLASRKALVEVAALLLHMRRLMDTLPDERYTAMLDRLAAVTARRAYRDLIARQHRALWLYGIPYAALRAWGRDDAELRFMIEQAVAARYPVTWERLPYRFLDYLHFLDAADIPHQLIPPEHVFPLTLLATAPNVAELEEDDVYAITHAVFYMTRYGFGPEHWPTGLDLDATAKLIDALLEQYTDAEHADLTAELLMCADCVGIEQSDAVAAAWDMLQRLQAPSGAIPAPDHIVPRAYTGERQDAAYLEWKRCYHATVMTVMAAAYRRRANVAPNGSTRLRHPMSRAVAARPPEVERVVKGVERATAWLDDQAAHAASARSLLAAAGAFVARRFTAAAGSVVARCLTNATGAADPALAAATAAARRVSESPVTSHVAAGVDLLALLAVVLPSRVSTELAKKLIGAPGKPEILRRVDPRGPIDGLAALVLSRDAIQPFAAYAERATRRCAAVRAYREYRLGDAAAIVSALVLAGDGAERATRDVVEALLGQQRHDGSFGYAASDVEDERVATTRVIWTARAALALAAFCNPAAAREVWTEAVCITAV